MQQHLYYYWNIYRRLFPLDDESRSFFDALTPRTGTILDAGSGPGDLAAALAAPGRAIVGIDLEHAEASMPVPLLRADLLAMPLRDSVVDAVISRLFGLAYAAVANRIAADVLADELNRVGSPACAIIAELPVAHRPLRLQGITESAEIAPDAFYRFEYLDELFRTPYGSALQTSIAMTTAGVEYRIDAPLMVFHPEGVRLWMARAGFDVRCFHAPYDLASAVPEPPDDCLRAIVQATRFGGGGAAAPSTVANG
jgi:SAM-dependent methyltransferase